MYRPVRTESDNPPVSPIQPSHCIHLHSHKIPTWAAALQDVDEANGKMQRAKWEISSGIVGNWADLISILQIRFEFRCILPESPPLHVDFVPVRTLAGGFSIGLNGSRSETCVLMCLKLLDGERALDRCNSFRAKICYHSAS